MAASPRAAADGAAAAAAFRLMAEINVTPMVDVMLVLLVIFMVTAPLADGRRAGRPAARPMPAHSRATTSRWSVTVTPTAGSSCRKPR